MESKIIEGREGKLLLVVRPTSFVPFNNGSLFTSRSQKDPLPLDRAVKKGSISLSLSRLSFSLFSLSVYTVPCSPHDVEGLPRPVERVTLPLGQVHLRRVAGAKINLF
jgi:hypothetical protein